VIYVASSWRNHQQPSVVEALRSAGHQVYDFRHPREGDSGFAWSEIDPEWLRWTPAAYRAALDHPLAVSGFRSDMDALIACDTCVLVLPCGRSAHLELGWAAGAGKRTFVLMAQPEEPELMYRMLHGVCLSVDELVLALASPPSPVEEPRPEPDCKGCEACPECKRGIDSYGSVCLSCGGTGRSPSPGRAP